VNPEEEHERSPAEEAWEQEETGPGPEDELIDQAWDKLDEGDAQAALATLLQVDADWPERWIPEALARLELGELAAARAVLVQAAEFEGMADHPDFLWAEGRVLLGEWRFSEARERFEHLLQIETSTGVLERLSLCHEMEGDFESADLRFAQAAALDPSFQVPPRLAPEEFERVLGQAIDALPKEFRRELEHCEVLVDAVPSPWMCDPRDPAVTPPELLGLFLGASQLEHAAEESGELGPRIFLFQRNLERAARDEAQLREEIRVTLYHELGHRLGFDEEGVAGMGLE
jgi:predicted Zn-dependent protease with MMP-like domain